jgi:hypothetical protein
MRLRPGGGGGGGHYMSAHPNPKFGPASAHTSFDRCWQLCRAATLWFHPLAARRSNFVCARKLAQEHTYLPHTPQVRIVEPSGSVGTQYPKEVGSQWLGTIENLNAGLAQAR